ncbi:MAG: hypothetical protein ACKPEO_27810 [Sphaerospermopsis kisseleviana]
MTRKSTPLLLAARKELRAASPELKIMWKFLITHHPWIRGNLYHDN